MAAAAVVELMESRVVFALTAHCVDWQTERLLRDAIDRVVGGATEKAHTDDGAISAHVTPMTTTAIREPAILLVIYSLSSAIIPRFSPLALCYRMLCFYLSTESL
mmetsp:Transcript_6929/g.12455  ORF Transcript_6929/g.12455 Transcript_6929/m.12455 type:complete len:105 (-) Transcript_6929:23-337(-)